ncbi:MAG: multicopper oxidase domain-containing protein, partial [Gemmatimonadales bacterium]
MLVVLGVVGWARRASEPDPLPRDALPVVVANDNRSPAGELRNGELELRLVARMARWFPEAEAGPYVDVATFAEEDGPPRIPAPLIRVPSGTAVAVTIRNELPDSTLWVHGLMTRPAATDDSVAIAPGASRVFRFEAGAPGTYLYRATPGVIRRLVPGDLDPARQEREQLAGAFVVDPPGAPMDDRIFVINIWGDPIDSLHYRNAVAINGRSWPHTERIDAQVGDSLRWRVVNASARNHPMHLHGFYFRVDARG